MFSCDPRVILLKGVVLLYISQVLDLYIVDTNIKLPLFTLAIFFNISFTDSEEGQISDQWNSKSSHPDSTIY